MTQTLVRNLDGVETLIARYRAAGIEDIFHDFLPRRWHEMLNEINHKEVLANLLSWIFQNARKTSAVQKLNDAGIEAN